MLALAVLPRLRVGGRQLMESEAPGPELEALTASIRDTARRLWLLYVALTALLILILAALRLDGGRRAHEPLQRGRLRLLGDADGRLRHRPALAGGLRARLAVGARALHDDRRARTSRCSTARSYAGSRSRSCATRSSASTSACWLLASAVAGRRSSGTPGSARGRRRSGEAAFQTVSIMTTTGFASTDFATWVVAAPAAAMLIVALMFPGGSAGSTAGSIKIVRHLVIGKVLRRELDQAMHPEYVAPDPRQPRGRRRAHGSRRDRVRAPLRRHLRRRRRAAPPRRAPGRPRAVAVRRAGRFGDDARQRRPRLRLRRARSGRSSPSATSRPAS